MGELFPIKGHVIVHFKRLGKSFTVLRIAISESVITMVMRDHEELIELKTSNSPELIEDLSSFQKQSTEKDLFLMYVDEETPELSWGVTRLEAFQSH
ncbi:TPA: hypothetical protein EYP44_04740 [Candidatus Bathyarchaeota archaeon]|nr:hypothetical protein [Candidatus Bathyarchaeota archaeon]